MDLHDLGRLRQDPRMELRHLRYFVAVAEERHFGRAAERLHIAQPPLSQQIRRMEVELGAPLFHRTTRRVELAPAGEVLLERARDIIAAVDAAVDDARRAARGELGRLSIGFTGSATYALLPAVATAVRRELPGVELTLSGEMLTPAQVDGLLDGTIDLAILRPPVQRRELEMQVVRRERVIAVLPADHRLAALEAVPVEDLADEPFVTYPSQFRSVLHDVVERMCEAHGFLPRVALEVRETATLVSFVAAGIGVSIVPASVAQMAVAGAVYRPLSDEDDEVELALAWRRGDDSPLLARALDVVRASIAATDAAAALVP
jgi:DNA-binding transcriptional LysR family regulator